MRRPIALLTLAAALTAGCFYAPTGTNKATDAVPVPADGKVSLSYTVPAGKDATKVTFKVEEKPDVTALDDSTNNPHTVSLDVSSLAAGFYTVDVLLNDETDPTAKLFFVVPGAAPAASDTGSSDTSGSGGAAEGS
jgi:hypothetical protein